MDNRFNPLFPSYPYNELRTLQMEREVFEEFRTQFGLFANNALTGFPIEWDDIGRGGLNATGPNSVLQRFNREQDDGRKIALLNTQLQLFGLGRIPAYVDAVAAGNRERFVNILDPTEYPGVLFPPR